MMTRSMFWVTFTLLIGCPVAIFQLDWSHAESDKQYAGRKIELCNGATWYVLHEWESGSWLVEETMPDGSFWRYAIEEESIRAAIAGKYPPLCDERAPLLLASPVEASRPQ